jgi:hypothetical protein
MVVGVYFQRSNVELIKWHFLAALSRWRFRFGRYETEAASRVDFSRDSIVTMQAVETFLWFNDARRDD